MTKNLKLKSENGMTLIELLIVLSILLILSLSVAMSIRSLEKRNLQSSAVQLQNHIRYIQNMSIQEGTRYSIIFSLHNNTYIIMRMENGVFRPIETVTFENGTEIFQVSAVNNTISFTPNGTTGSASTIVLINGNFRVNLTVTLGAGKVNMTDIRPIN